MSDFPTYLENLRPALDATLERLLPAADIRPVRLHEAMRYSTFAGGKRVRPGLTVLAGEALGVDRALLLPGAAALEMVHTYSLVHDDLPALDNDDLRRGRATAHRAFDEATAILVGDALLTLGLATLASEPTALAPEHRRQAVVAVGRAIGSTGMIGGQVDDLAAERNWPEDRDEAAALLEAIHRRKTGNLLTVCLELAGIYAGVDEQQAGLLVSLGDALGLMFQIADDVIDVEGSDTALGKTAGKDAASQKLTYPGLFGLEAAKGRLAETRAEADRLAQALPNGPGLFPGVISYLATRDR